MDDLNVYLAIAYEVLHIPIYASAGLLIILGIFLALTRAISTIF